MNLHVDDEDGGPYPTPNAFRDNALELKTKVL